MILVEPNVELLPVSKTYEDMLHDIERAARICYASDGASSKLNTEQFLLSLYNRKHNRPFEFGTLYINIKRTPSDDENQLIKLIHKSPWTRTVYYESNMYLTTNMRVVKENASRLLGDTEEAFRFAFTFAHKFFGWTPYHVERQTFHWTVSRGIADEFRTHTMISSLMQSTRYCNYSLDKFDKQIRICRPCWMEHSAEWLNAAHAGQPTIMENIFLGAWREDEQRYNSAIINGAKAQQARGILPLEVKTEFIQCAFESDWKGFFDQRAFDSTGPAHPDAKFIATRAYELYENREQIVIE